MHRSLGIVAASTGVAAAVALTLNVTGVVRLPVGPLGTSELPGEGRQMAIAPQDSPDAIYTTVIVNNGWPVPVRLEAVRPIEPAGQARAEILGAQPYSVETLGGDQQLVLGGVRERPAEWAGDHPVAGTQVPAAAEGTGAVALVRVRAEPGEATDVQGYEIEYRVGPFAFRAVSTINSLVLCSNDGSVPPGCDDAGEAASAVGRLLADSRWRLLFDEPTRDAASLDRAASAAGYEGEMARAFVFTLTSEGEGDRDVLVAPGVDGEWQIMTPLE